MMKIITETSLRINEYSNIEELKKTYKREQRIEYVCISCNETKYGSLRFLKSYPIRCQKCTAKLPQDWRTPEINKQIYLKSQQTLIEHYGSVENAIKARLEKAGDTLEKQYGYRNAFQIEEFKQKAKATIQKKFGVSNVSQSIDIQEKMKQTCQSHFGVPYPSQSIEVQEKIIETNIERYNTKCPLQNEQVYLKTVATLQLKYGVDHPSKSELIQNKKVQTYNSHTGYNYPLQNPTVLDNLHKRNLEHYGSEFPKFKYMYDNINFDSSWELAFYIYCIDHNIQIKREPCYFEYPYQGTTHKYFPDFQIPCGLVEIKGGQLYKNGKLYNAYNSSLNGICEAKQQCLIENNVYIIDKEKIKVFLKYVSITYGKTFLKKYKRSNKTPL